MEFYEVTSLGNWQTMSERRMEEESQLNGKDLHERSVTGPNCLVMSGRLWIKEILHRVQTGISLSRSHIGWTGGRGILEQMSSGVVHQPMISISDWSQKVTRWLYGCKTSLLQKQN